MTFLLENADFAKHILQYLAVFAILIWQNGKYFSFRLQYLK